MRLLSVSVMGALVLGVACSLTATTARAAPDCEVCAHWYQICQSDPTAPECDYYAGMCGRCPPLYSVGAVPKAKTHDGTPVMIDNASRKRIATR